jgi:hypothetical protein
LESAATAPAAMPMTTTTAPVMSATRRVCPRRAAQRAARVGASDSELGSDTA